MAATSYVFYTDTPNSSRFLSMLVSPKEVVMGSDVYQVMYCHLLCGLRFWDSVDGIRAPYAAGLIRAFSLLEAKWEQLCIDLENGFPSKEIVTDNSIRECVVQILSGSQLDLSNRVRLICGGKKWDGILGKLWPNARYVKTVSSGSMQQYYSKLKFYAGNMPIVGGDYFASECSVALNFDIMQPPERTSYVMLPTAAYFEFLPFDSHGSGNGTAQQETVGLSGVEVGKMYEVVVTTYRGLYRYRLGDIVRVIGFHNSSPEVEFVMRDPQSSHGMITERDVISAVERFQLAVKDGIDTEITEFSSFLEVKKQPKQLKIFIEVKEGSALLPNEKLEEYLGDLRKYCAFIEQSLGGIYGVMKARNELGPLILVIVKPGSFDSLLRVAIENGSSASQYKPPKILRSYKIVELLESSAIVTIEA
ncbi:hypothetical protein M9H77_01577 [Catharanthus roseus]|uniref:Uncharacterized protein n=1 Tax=Catharanthus roseus TaxID=4058 RepID=A0ACC0C638_CATRO|nr:hypothetical protein M9H77_01577 [Catharanthus roseus]